MFLGLRHPLLGLEPCGHIPPDDAQQFRAGARPARRTGAPGDADRRGAGPRPTRVRRSRRSGRTPPPARRCRAAPQINVIPINSVRGNPRTAQAAGFALAEGEVDDPPVGIPNGSQQRQTIHHGVQGRAEKCLCGCAAEVTGHAWDSGTHREETSVSPDRPEGPVAAPQVYCRRKAGQNLRRT